MILCRTSSIFNSNYVGRIYISYITGWRCSIRANWIPWQRPILEAWGLRRYGTLDWIRINTLQMEMFQDWQRRDNQHWQKNLKTQTKWREMDARIDLAMNDADSDDPPTTAREIWALLNAHHQTWRSLGNTQARDEGRILQSHRSRGLWHGLGTSNLRKLREELYLIENKVLPLKILSRWWSGGGQENWLVEMWVVYVSYIFSKIQLDIRQNSDSEGTKNGEMISIFAKSSWKKHNYLFSSWTRKKTNYAAAIPKLTWDQSLAGDLVHVVVG